MRYLQKSTDSSIIFKGLSYAKSHQRTPLRELLIEEQTGYCAYTEKYIDPIDACDIEHFDDRKKNTDQDSYWNWYAVLHKVNQKKGKIENFLPVLLPYNDNLSDRIQYQHGMFITLNPDDIEAQNLIELLRWNDAGLAESRYKHISHIKSIREFYPGNDDEFIEYLKSEPTNLSYISTLEVELGLTIT